MTVAAVFQVCVVPRTTLLFRVTLFEPVVVAAELMSMPDVPKVSVLPALITTGELTVVTCMPCQLRLAPRELVVLLPAAEVHAAMSPVPGSPPDQLAGSLSGSALLAFVRVAP